MKVLVIGSGGRENAICKKMRESDRVDEVFIIPGNGGSDIYAERIDIQVDDVEAIKDFAIEKEIDLTVVGPEDPLVAGITDIFKEAGLAIFGPDKFSSQLEGSKTFAKEFMERYDIPTGKYMHFDDYHEAVEAIKDWDFPIVIKADGLCAGKGVEICETPVEAVYIIKDILLEKKFGEEGNSMIVEEYLEGFESSVFCIASKGKLSYFGTAKDHKRIYDGDQGRNTGGMGCYSPNLLVNDESFDIIKNEIIPKIEAGLLKDGHDFDGVLFIGFMITKEGPKVLEFNVRFGDPETQVLLPRLKNDLYTVLEKAVDGSLHGENLEFSDDIAMTVIMSSGGYPEGYKTGYEITGLEEFSTESDLYVIHNGTDKKDDSIYTSGGRVLSVTCIGKDLDECRDKIYSSIGKIDFANKFYRKDIGAI